MKSINHFISKSLFGPGMLAVLLLAFSCTQDTASENLGSEELNAVSVKGKKARPIKARLDFLFDYSNNINTVECVPGVYLFKTIVSGNMSHLGNLQPGLEFDEDTNEPISGSYFIPVSCQIVSPPPALVLETEYKSVYVAANGDELHAIENVFLTFTSERTGTFAGTGTIEGGTGRFQNASGTWESKNGVFDATIEGNSASWEIEGEITY